jgi:hypothetical protein
LKGSVRDSNPIFRLADIDFYKLGLSLGQAVGSILDAQEQGVVPPASLLMSSGRGVWAFWLLVGEGSEPFLRAWPENVELYRRVQSRITEVFAASQHKEGVWMSATTVALC